MKAASGWIRVAAAMVFLLAGAQSEAGSATLTPQSKHNISNNFTPEFYEASGLGIAKNESKLWSVGDENDFAMYKMELNGAAVSNATAGPASGVTAIQDASFEGVTYAPPLPGISDDHYIYLVDENSSSVVPVNYNTNKYNAPIPLSGMAGYSSIVCRGSSQTVEDAFDGAEADNIGLEGITWNSHLSSFFLLKEKNPGLLIQVSADLRTIRACQTLTYNNADYSDVSYDSVRRKYWIVSDEGRSLALYDWSSASAVQQWGLGYDGGEGVAYNPATSQLFIATDNGGGQTSYLYVYKVQ
jgi:SdiA-regulated